MCETKSLTLEIEGMKANGVFLGKSPSGVQKIWVKPSDSKKFARKLNSLNGLRVRVTPVKEIVRIDKFHDNDKLTITSKVRKYPKASRDDVENYFLEHGKLPPANYKGKS